MEDTGKKLDFRDLTPPVAFGHAGLSLSGIEYLWQYEHNDLG